MVTASAVIALMVLVGGVAAERPADGQTPAIEEPGHEPAPLSWREST